MFVKNCVICYYAIQLLLCFSRVQLNIEKYNYIYYVFVFQCFRRLFFAIRNLIDPKLESGLSFDLSPTRVKRPMPSSGMLKAESIKDRKLLNQSFYSFFYKYSSSSSKSEMTINQIDRPVVAVVRAFRSRVVG